MHALAFVDRTMIGGALPLMRHDVLMSDAQAGWLIGTAFALPYGVTALVVAALRRNRPPSTGWALAGGVIWTAGSVATGLAGSVAALTAARALIGIGQGVFVPMAIGKLLNAASADRRGGALGIFTGGATFGRSVALLAVGALLALLGPLARESGAPAWRWLFALTAIPNVLAFAALALAPSRQGVGSLDLTAITTQVRWRSLLPRFVIAVTPVLLAQAVLGWLPTLFVRLHGLSATRAALLLGSVTLVAAPSGPVFAGWLVSRTRRLEHWMPVAVLAGLILTLMLLTIMIEAPTLPLATAVAAAMLVSLGMTLFSGLFGLQLMIPPDARVSINGIYLAFATVVGFGFGPLIAGIVSAGGEDGPSLGRALIITGLVATAACGFTLPAAFRSASVA